MLEWDWHTAGHGVSLTALIGVLAGLFTPLAAFLTAAWFGLQIYESKTVQARLRARRERKLALLKLRLNEIEKSIGIK